MTKLFSARFLLAGFIVLLVALFMFAVAGNLRRSDVAVVNEFVRSEDDLVMKQLNYTETRDGVRKWTVQADSASHNLKHEVAQLEHLTLIIYNPTLSDLTVTSSAGELDLKNRQVLLSGDVVLKAATGETFYTDELLFVDSEKVVRTDSPVLFMAKGVTVSGKGMRYNVTNRQLILKSNVEAVYGKGVNVQ